MHLSLTTTFPLDSPPVGDYHEATLMASPVLAMSDERYQDGMKIRRAVLGDAHVDKAEASKTSFDADFQRFLLCTSALRATPASRPMR